MVTKTPKNPKNMALPKGVKSPVDYTKLYMSNELEGEVLDEKNRDKTMNDHYNWRETLDEKCWKGYEKKGMKTMFGKRYPNCVKKSKKKK